MTIAVHVLFVHLFCFRISYLFQNIFSCFRTTYSVLEHPFEFQNILFCFKTSLCVLKCEKKVEKQQFFRPFCCKKCAKVRSHIAPKKKGPHARTLHAHFRMHFAHTSAHTSHVRKCNITHMCAATQHLHNGDAGGCLKGQLISKQIMVSKTSQSEVSQL